VDINNHTYTGENPFGSLPREKALELYEKFQSKSSKINDYSVIYIPTALEHAKRCVDEILTEVKEFADPEIVLLRVIYWEKVKEELDKL